MNTTQQNKTVTIAEYQQWQRNQEAKMESAFEDYVKMADMREREN